MAKKEQDVFDYNAEITFLRAHGPMQSYFLYGPEDYLRECFLKELKSICVAEECDFSYKVINGPVIDLDELDEAVNSMPFFSEHVLVEVRDYDINHSRELDLVRLKTILTDIPEFCTVAFSYSAAYVPDGRLSGVKLLKKICRTVHFTEQSQSSINKWVRNRFSSFHKNISSGDAEYLIFLSGTRMSGLIPEIEKIASYSASDSISKSDIDAVATRIPEADVFSLAELLAQNKTDSAAKLLSDLLSNKDNHPIMLTALIGQHFRQLYAVKLGKNLGRSHTDIMELSGVRFQFVLDKLISEAKSYSIEELGFLIRLCAEYDYKLKSTGFDPEVLVRELFARIAVRK